MVPLRPPFKEAWARHPSDAFRLSSTVDVLLCPAHLVASASHHLPRFATSHFATPRFATSGGVPLPRFVRCIDLIFWSFSPRSSSPCSLCSIIFCEAVAIYGVIVAIILQTKVENVKPNADGTYSLAANNAGYAILGAGSVTGWANLACGLSVGVVGSSAALADAANSTLFVKILVVEIFASALGLFGIIIGIIMAGNADFLGTR